MGYGKKAVFNPKEDNRGLSTQENIAIGQACNLSEHRTTEIWLKNGKSFGEEFWKEYKETALKFFMANEEIRDQVSVLKRRAKGLISDNIPPPSTGDTNSTDSPASIKKVDNIRMDV